MLLKLMEKGIYVKTQTFYIILHVTCGHIESTRIHEQFTVSLLSQNLGHLSKSDVITNTHTNLTPGSCEASEAVTRCQGI